MRVLITGGTGLIGRGVTRALRSLGHDIRILSRSVEPGTDPHIETWRASVTDPAALQGAAADCDVVLHIAGIVAESPPDLTFERVNVDGTRNVIAEAQRARARRLVHVSSLGADIGSSRYHKSKLSAERLVAGFTGESLIVRPGNVYGPGDAVLSRLIRYARALPAVPLIDAGVQPFQPIWHEDLAAALAHLASSDECGVIEVAAPDLVTLADVFDQIAELTGRNPVRLPLPSPLLDWLARLSERLGIDTPLHRDTLQMLIDGNYIRDQHRNALPRLIAQPTRFHDGLRKLLHDLPPQTLEEGFGSAQHRRISVRISAPQLDARTLFDAFVSDYKHFLPVEAGTKPNSPARLEEDAVLALTLPLAGNVSVRVDEAYDRAVTLSALDGHFLAGFVRFTFDDRERDVVIFEINVYDRPATAIHTVAMTFGGNWLQERAWMQTAERVLAASGGCSATGVQHETHRLGADEIARVQEWHERLTTRRRDTRDRPA